MFDADQLLLFIAAGLLLNLTPGPDLLYIIARALSQGRSAGLMSALGISAGCLVHTLAAAFGVSLLLRASPVAYDLLRLAGAAYLIYLGIKALRDSSAQRIARLQATPLKTIFWQGFATNVLNPKVALFFLAFLPQFTDPAGNYSVTAQVLVLGALFIFNGFWVCWLVAWGAATAGGWVSRSGFSRWMNRLSGGMLVALGLNLALRAD